MKVHLSDIARKVGVSKMTVSRALREDPSVSVASRKKILAAAKELGYVPNPKLARLMSEMAHSRSHANSLGELAYISTEHTEWGWQQYYHQLSCYQGAQAEAKAYGYKLLPVWALSRRFSHGRLSEVLWSRGVDGIIVQPLGRGMIGRTLDIDWEKFSSVQIGATLAVPKLNLVRHNHYGGMTQTLLAMERMGYERIGLCFSSDSDIRSYHRWAAAYLYWRTIRGFTDRTLPSFHYAPGQVDPKALKTWIRQHKITGIIGMGTELVNTCLKIGLKVPDDIGISVLDRPGGESNVAGIDQRAAQIGSMAVDMLIMAVRKGAKGVPEHPQQTIVEGEWVQGGTVRPLKPVTEIKSPHDMTDIESSF